MLSKFINVVKNYKEYIFFCRNHQIFCKIEIFVNHAMLYATHHSHSRWQTISRKYKSPDIPLWFFCDQCINRLLVFWFYHILLKWYVIDSYFITFILGHIGSFIQSHGMQIHVMDIITAYLNLADCNAIEMTPILMTL